MEQMVLCAVAMVTLGWWAGVVPWSMAIAVRPQAGISRPRVE